MSGESGVQKASDDDSKSIRRELLSAAEVVDDLHVTMLIQSAQLHGCVQVCENAVFVRKFCILSVEIF